MKFKESKYYDKKLLGENLYDFITDNNKIFTVQEYFRLNDIQKEYYIKDEKNDYKLKVCSDHYELDCQVHDFYLFLVFDKPVHIAGKYCTHVVAPEVVINSNQNTHTARCVTDKLIINNRIKNVYEMNYLKVKNIYFYGSKVSFWASEISNFFIFNKELKFYEFSEFLKYHKIKFIGKCKDLKKKILNDKSLKDRIIHIE